MESGHGGSAQLSTFVASDDDEATKQILQVARIVGFDAVDAGPLRNARRLESLGYLNIQLAYALGIGREIGLKLIHGGARGGTSDAVGPCSSSASPGRRPGSSASGAGALI